MFILKEKQRLTMKKQEALLGIALIIPALIFIIIFVLVPLLGTIGFGFTSYNLLRPDRGIVFVGFENYKYLIEAKILQPALLNSVVITISSVSMQIIIGMGIALLLNRQFIGRAFIRTTFIVPWAVPSIVGAFTLLWIFDGQFGPFNKLLISIGILDKGIPWFGSSDTALLSVIIAHIWKGLPYVVLVFLAGLQTIDLEILDAAKVDGVDPWKEFWHIILPSLRDVIAITLVLRIIWYFNYFDFIYLLTGGGPGDATMTLPLVTYIAAFRNFQIGKAATLATIMAIVLMIFTVLFLRLFMRKDE